MTRAESAPRSRTRLRNLGLRGRPVVDPAPTQPILRKMGRPDLGRAVSVKSPSGRSSCDVKRVV